MRLRQSSYVKLFRLSSFTGQLCLATRPACRLQPTLHTGPPLHLAQKLTMHSIRLVTNCGKEDTVLADQAGLLGTAPTSTTEDTAPPVEKNRVGNTLVVKGRSLRTPSPLFGAKCDDDSEAESFQGGRTEEVDRDTKGRAFAWCQDFLSGSWKTLREDDFQISIVR